MDKSVSSTAPTSKQLSSKQRSKKKPLQVSTNTAKSAIRSPRKIVPSKVDAIKELVHQDDENRDDKLKKEVQVDEKKQTKIKQKGSKMKSQSKPTSDAETRSINGGQAKLVEDPYNDKNEKIEKIEKKKVDVARSTGVPDLITSSSSSSANNKQASSNNDDDGKSNAIHEGTSSQTSDVNQMLTSQQPNADYWEQVAEARRQALEEVIEENDQLREELEVAKAEVEHFQKLVKKALKLATELDIDLFNMPSSDDHHDEQDQDESSD